MTEGRSGGRSLRIDFGPGVVQRQEPMRIQVIVPEPAIEGLNKRIVGRLAGREKSNITLFI